MESRIQGIVKTQRRSMKTGKHPPTRVLNQIPCQSRVGYAFCNTLFRFNLNFC
ncbi:MAG: hypothetical protein P8X79_20075 [Reinekea sp.]